MTIFTQRRLGDGVLEQYDAPLSDVLGVVAEETLLYSPTLKISRSAELTEAEEGALNLPTRLGLGAASLLNPAYGAFAAAQGPGLPSIFRNEPDSPVVKADVARQRVKDEGVDLQIPDDGIRSRALDILIARKKEERRRQDVLSRAPSGVGAGAAKLGVMLGASMLDPLNVAAAFIPIVGPTRYAMSLRNAGGALGRAGVRARLGAVEGAVGAAAVEPIIYAGAAQEQADYDLIDSTLNIAFGTALGGGLHVGAGAVGDAIKRGADWRQARADESALAQSIDRLDLQAKEAALRTGVAQAMTGRAIDVEPVITYAANSNVEQPLRAAVGQDFFPVDAPIDPTTGVPGFTVYHGSPHDFDRFSMDKIGTGEGAQAYGHGLYFAEKEGVARSYRDAVSSQHGAQPTLPDGTVLDYDDPRYMAAAWNKIRGSRQAAIKYLESVKPSKNSTTPPESVAEAIRILKSDEPLAEYRVPGHMYEVRINASPDDFLDWDKPLSEQPEKVRKALKKTGMPAVPKRKGGEFYDNFVSARGGSEATRSLREQGIKGIRYLDAGSRGAGDGSRNYVVFDDSIITTVRRDDELLLKQPDDLRARAAASFAPEGFRLYDTEAIRSAEAKIAEAPADDKMPEASLEMALEDVQRLSASLGMEESLKAEMAVYDELAQTAEAYGRAVAAAASCQLRRGA